MLYKMYRNRRILIISAHMIEINRVFSSECVYHKKAIKDKQEHEKASGDDGYNNL